MKELDLEKTQELLQNTKSNIDKAFDSLKTIQDIVKIRGKRGQDGPFKVIDKYTQGIIEGKVYTIGAFSNTGKSQFAYEYVSYFLKQGKRVMFVSTEVSTGDLLGFIIRNFYRYNYNDVIRGDINVKKEDFNNLFLFDDIHSFEEISKKAIEYKPDFIFIDFIQSINHIGGSEYEKMTNLAIDLQKLAIQRNITIFSLSQVNNESRKLDGINLTLKGSGSLFASSDVIFGLYRDAGFVKLCITKNKFGPYNKIFDINMNFINGEIKLVESIENNDI